MFTEQDLPSKCFMRLSPMLIVALFLGSCNQTPADRTGEKANKKDTAVTPAARVLSVSDIPCLFYDRAQFVNTLTTYRNAHADNPHNKLILTFFTKDPLSNNVQLELIAYKAKNHAHHGQNEGTAVTRPDTLARIDTCHTFELRSEIYVFGNNEVSLPALQNRVIKGKDTIRRFRGFIFEPFVDSASRHVVFKIFPIDSSGIKIPLDKRFTDAEIISNPSPPLKPID